MKIHQVMESFLPSVLSEIVLDYMPDTHLKRRFYVKVEDGIYASRAHLFLFETQYSIDDKLQNIIMIDSKMYNTDILDLLIKSFIHRTNTPCIKLIQNYTQDEVFKKLINEMFLRVTISSDPSHMLHCLRSRCAFINNAPMFGRIVDNTVIEIPIPDPADLMYTIVYPPHRKNPLLKCVKTYSISQLTGYLSPLVPYREFSQKERLELETVENL